jgi:predicted ATP-grasp superfamily ATP-dependent carboligase
MHDDRSNHDGATAGPPTGLVILGGTHGSLALARSLGRVGVPVWLVSNDNPLPSWSRHIRRTLPWPGPSDESALPFLLDIAGKHGLKDCLLVPAGDGEVRLVSQFVDRLSAHYRIVLPAWDELKWMCEKPLLYCRAAELGLDIPQTHAFASLEEASRAELRFPLVLKPNMGGGQDAFTRAKVLRADDRATFLRHFADAAGLVGASNIVVQELIPGNGESQFSYAALWNDGAPVAEFTARRARQYPVEFGYTSTYVEVADEPEVVEAARRLLASIRYRGLVEIEFKRDPRDGKLKVLDVNPRPWSWFGLAAAAGIDLGAMLWAVARGEPVERPSAPRRASWMYLARDAVASAKLISSGRLAVGDYLRSFASVRAWAAFAASDMAPCLIDLPLTVWRVLSRRVFRIS